MTGATVRVDVREEVEAAEVQAVRAARVVRARHTRPVVAVRTVVVEVRVVAVTDSGEEDPIAIGASNLVATD